MPLVLARIDDRFIHGQVTVGWSRKLQPDRIILCNDKIAADPWQSRVYASSVPPQMRVSVLDRESTARFLAGDGMLDRGEDIILLVGSPIDMQDLHRRGLPIGEVNVGGMHYMKGKRELLEFVYVDKRDLKALRALQDDGVRLVAQTVPGVKAIELDGDQLAELENML
ncbi:PTS sugar transporter subunit IIB [bacterium]|nr:PTS sugar transporter subunit IIB [bacterium]MBU1072281.1 PTS sugar transporter subunit IIB [bacterium]MBU1674746.1 PTS sugar transporter subunit IIB [bacterium]